MKIGIGSDHAGFAYKELIRAHLSQLGHEVVDCGTFSPERTDYPTYIFPVACGIADGTFERGIVLGGSGNGEAMCANRVKGVRCVLCWNLESARLGRLHNDANCLSIGERMVDEKLTLQIVDLWLETAFEGGRHVARLAMLDE